MKVMHRLNALIGCWRMTRATPPIDVGECVEMEFELTGRLIYGILEDGRWQVMLLTYRIEGDILVSNQPSAPREERARFAISETGELVLGWHGQATTFRRISARSFSLPRD